MRTIVAREEAMSQKLLRFIEMIRSRHICGICKNEFMSKRHLNEHMPNHIGISYICDYCKLNCSTWSSFQEHWLVHRSVIFCSFCYKMHTNYWRLKLHWKMHEPYECEKCYDMFKTLSDLREHHVLFHPEIPFNLPFRPPPVEREE